MRDKVAEWIAKCIEARIERLRAGHDLSQDHIRRSHRQISRSEDLLKLPVPQTWQREPPE
jgi:hypothetical protein